MLNYKSLSGGEVLYWHGELYFWMASGVYSLKASNLKKHHQINNRRKVDLTILDTENGNESTISTVYPADFDDYEIIYRLISGTASCDCVRGQLLYGSTLEFICNKGPNRFVLKKMAIIGEDNSEDLIMRFKAFV